MKNKFKKIVQRFTILFYLERMKPLFSVLFILSFLFSEITIPSPNLNHWQPLVEGKISVEWKEIDAIQWCRSQTVIPVSISRVEQIIEDKQNYARVFKRVDFANIITEDIVHLALDMPFPFSGRDYVVQYIQSIEGKDQVYQFTAVTEPKVAIRGDYVRLINAAGEWRLTALDSNRTKVTYLWNGELLGDFPDWALPRAWETQGIEVLTWLEEALIK